MSEFYEGISWLLNGQIQLLFFIVGDKEIQYSVSDFKISSNITYIELFDYREEEPIYPVVLLEIRASVECRNAEKIVREVFLAFRNRPEIVVCMYEGAYMEAKDLTDPIYIEDIYAARTPQVELFAFSDDLPHSSEWRDAISKIQAQIIERYQ